MLGIVCYKSRYYTSVFASRSSSCPSMAVCGLLLIMLAIEVSWDVHTQTLKLMWQMTSLQVIMIIRITSHFSGGGHSMVLNV